MKIKNRILFFAAALSLCATLFSITASAAIPTYYQGYYDCTTVSNYLLQIPSATTSNFRGSYSGELNGVFACTDADPNRIYINTFLTTDNLIIRYNTCAKLYGDSFVPQSGGLTLFSTILDNQDESVQIRVKGSNGSYFYYER